MNIDRNCRKCGICIPNRIKIDGKTKNLQSRKFCLTCSPYGKHNTKANDPDGLSYKKGSYGNWSDKAKKDNINSVLKRGKERKKELVRLSGGQCLKCGYNKSYSVLSFHHRKPEDKCFGLTRNHLWSTRWDKILEEHKKCDLLCMNCHIEYEEIRRSDKLINYENWLNNKKYEDKESVIGVLSLLF